MPESPVRRLPRGRHGLRRDEVEQAQRVRILIAMAEAMHEKGYAGTPVADVLTRAGVSRETFYQLFSSKQDCFLAAFDLVSEMLLTQLRAVAEEPGRPMERLGRTLDTYLEALATEPAYARVFLVEVYAAGPDAMQRRLALQQRIADALGDLLGASTPSDRFACQLVVAAVSAMVTGPLVSHDPGALRRLKAPLLDHVRRLAAGEPFFATG